MKILFVTSSSIRGGAQKHMRDMFLALTRLGCDVQLAAPKGWLTDELSACRGSVHILDARLKNVPALSRLIQRIRPDIVNTFILSGGCFGYLAWLPVRQGKIWITVNNQVLYPGIGRLQRRVYPLLYRWMARGAEAFLVKSENVSREVQCIVGPKCRVLAIRNGVDFAVFDRGRAYPAIRPALGLPSDAVIVVNVATLEAHKGQDILILAAERLLATRHDLYFLLVGEGDERDRYTGMIERHGLSGRVLLTGNRSDIAAILASSSLFVLPSRHEGLPNALMEAMSMGLPCVATDVGGVRELIPDDRYGVVIDRPEAESLASAIEAVLADPARAKAMGMAAYERMRAAYSQDAAAAQLAAIYRGQS